MFNVVFNKKNSDDIWEQDISSPYLIVGCKKHVGQIGRWHIEHVPVLNTTNIKHINNFTIALFYI